MNYPTIANAITPYSWFFILYNSKSKIDTSTPSKLEIFFLLDSGASISVLLPKYNILPLKLTLFLSKPKFLFYSTLISLAILLLTMTLVHFFPFAVANIKYNILGTPSFEQYVKPLDNENMTLLFEDTPNSHIHSIPFAAHKEKDYPLFSLIYTINVSRNLFFLFSNSSKTVHFPNKSSSSLSFETTENETILPSPPHTYFNECLNSIFNSLQLHDPTKTILPPSHCSVVIQNITNHSATLPFGCIGYIEVPATLDLPSAYNVHDINLLVHSVLNSYYPTLVEPRPPLRSSSLTSKLSSSSFELHTLQPTQTFPHSNPTPNINSKHAIHTFFYHWITKFGPPQNLVTDRGTEYIYQDMAHLCSIFHNKNTRHVLPIHHGSMVSMKIKTAISSSFIFTRPS